MILVGRELEALVLNGSIQAPLSAVQPSHIDVTLRDLALIETVPLLEEQPQVDLAAGEKVAFDSKEMPVFLKPNDFALFALKEKITLPLDVTAEFFLDSGPARSCVEHSCATLLVPGWSGYLTLEIKNVAKYHTLKFSAGMSIGKIVFYKHGMTKGYAGRFQDQEEIQA